MHLAGALFTLSARLLMPFDVPMGVKGSEWMETAKVQETGVGTGGNLDLYILCNLQAVEFRLLRRSGELLAGAVRLGAVHMAGFGPRCWLYAALLADRPGKANG